MEMMVLQTLCAGAMAVVGALIARGWPQGGRPDRPARGAACEQQPDEFADDLAAMLAYTGEEEDENETV